MPKLRKDVDLDIYKYPLRKWINESLKVHPEIRVHNFLIEKGFEDGLENKTLKFHRNIKKEQSHTMHINIAANYCEVFGELLSTEFDLKESFVEGTSSIDTDPSHYGLKQG
ncbi:MAG: hypothetical protein AAF363_15595 [Bacteroidota bacterium]